MERRLIEGAPAWGPPGGAQGGRESRLEGEVFEPIMVGSGALQRPRSCERERGRHVER
ncbi:hypothetical protein GCM10020254_25530 [Streptomyces goshikiensis]